MREILSSQRLFLFLSLGLSLLVSSTASEGRDRETGDVKRRREREKRKERISLKAEREGESKKENITPGITRTMIFRHPLLFIFLSLFLAGFQDGGSDPQIFLVPNVKKFVENSDVKETKNYSIFRVDVTK